ncbi:hypothetical protein J5N97_013786 [Dioscorea zingiberensis]|uniref:Protein CHUP1, chloroplastic n=1 Tax=Dioscorea zingiberensis TaxID=325984 RepID=A0A9D5CTM2_9LILI|nr:hypothetical protein J5N97_013786 [Dioscorea zingiberensis]
MEEGDVCFAHLRNKLQACLDRNCHLEKENKALRQEIVHLKGQITRLQNQDTDRSMIWKKQQNPVNNSPSQEKQLIHGNNVEERLGFDNSLARREVFHSTIKARSPRVPRPPPRPSACIQLALKTTGKESQLLSPLLPPPPPPPSLPSEVQARSSNSVRKVPEVAETQLPPQPPPPPPPLPSKLQGRSSSSVKRAPEVVEFYRSITRRDGKPETKTGIVGTQVTTNAREMIGEIENRSAYLLAIKSDVETQGEFINFLTREVQNAAYREISDVEAFVKWLDDELSYLWPERKADAMREAAFSYRDLKNLESEVSSFCDDIRQPTGVALKRIRALQEKLECSVHNLERVRESASKRYREFQIPWEWMLDTGILAQLKSGSMTLAKQYMNRIVTQLQSDASSEDEELMLQGVRFAFRVHQFIGGFDEESRNTFQELRKLANSIYS